MRVGVLGGAAGVGKILERGISGDAWRKVSRESQEDPHGSFPKPDSNLG